MDQLLAPPRTASMQPFKSGQDPVRERKRFVTTSILRPVWILGGLRKLADDWTTIFERYEK